MVTQTIKKIVPMALKRKLKRLFWGTLWNIKPISSIFGLDRGQPIDRYYMEQFIHKNSVYIHGHVLEIAEDMYTKKFGGNRITKSDILHVTHDNPQATIIADLTTAEGIQPNQFDCIILTQTLQFIYNKNAVIETLYRILKPGGTVLATASGISQISSYDMERWGEYWRFTTLSAKKLFAISFPEEKICVESYGNVLVAASFLFGFAVEDLKKKELDYFDPNYQLVVTIRATK